MQLSLGLSYDPFSGRFPSSLDYGSKTLTPTARDVTLVV
jgi:hypothetical protein